MSGIKHCPNLLERATEEKKIYWYAPANISTASSRLLLALLLHSKAVIYDLCVNNCIL